jgi:hypothetical protein
MILRIVIYSHVIDVLRNIRMPIPYGRVFLIGYNALRSTIKGEINMSLDLLFLATGPNGPVEKPNLVVFEPQTGWRALVSPFT